MAQSDAPLLITGESGTGKELVARTIHASGPRADRPFIAVNCAAFPETLLEAELFGHEKGAFTGAVRARAGRFEAAGGGTLFLDEIGEIPLLAQAKLLRVVEEGVIEPLGTNRQVPVDVRLISATHGNLRERIEAGQFREDLYYRLNVVNIQLPALRERREDIPLLVEHFLRQISAEGSQERKVYAPEAVELLVASHWPGNIRQLYNVVRQNVALSPMRVISAEQVRSALGELRGRIRDDCRAQHLTGRQQRVARHLGRRILPDHARPHRRVGQAHRAPWIANVVEQRLRRREASDAITPRAARAAEERLA